MTRNQQAMMVLGIESLIVMCITIAIATAMLLEALGVTGSGQGQGAVAVLLAAVLWVVAVILSAALVIEVVRLFVRGRRSGKESCK